MDVERLLEIATKLNVPGLVNEGLSFIEKVMANTDRAEEILKHGEHAELERIHAETIEINEALIREAEAAAGEE